MSSDRKTLIRLAATLPKGSEERRVLLAELQKSAMGFPAIPKGLGNLAAPRVTHRLASSMNLFDVGLDWKNSRMLRDLQKSESEVAKWNQAYEREHGEVHDDGDQIQTWLGMLTDLLTRNNSTTDVKTFQYAKNLAEDLFHLWKAL
tara:strand:- start:769 stop:1206 length:438 start_codon:yes stop_codon:yes gene_type:complete